MKKFFTVLGGFLATVAVVFIVKFITTPNAINIVNFFYDDIIRFAENNRDSYEALIDYPFQQHIISHGEMLNGDMEKQSIYFVTKLTKKTEEGFTYMYDDNSIIATQWANCDLSNGTKSGNTYIFNFETITVKITPIKDHLYYTYTAWPDQRPTNNGG